MTINDAIPNLTLLIPRLASDSDGEIVATVSAIRRVLKSNDCDLHDMAAAISGGQQKHQRTSHQERAQTNRQQKRHDYSSAEPTADWDEILSFCMARSSQLGDRERQFVNDMEGNLQEWGRPTEKQGAWLMRIFNRLGGVQ